jgi:RimJ/RimL family protein N-acetyltransferase
VYAPGKIVFKGQSNANRNIIIRYPVLHDANALCIYINQLSKEKTFLRLQGEEKSLEDEQCYLKSQMEKNASNQAVTLLAFDDEKLIGKAEIEMLRKTERHVGVLSISVSKTFRGQGIGSLLMEHVHDIAVRAIPLLQLITLSIFSTNVIGLKMYKKYGYQEYGRLPKGSILEEQYVDLIFMYKNRPTG